MDFLERNLHALASAVDRASTAESAAHRRGWLQTLDPRAKIVGFSLLIAAVVSVRRLEAVAGLLALAAAVALSSRISPRLLLAQVWLGGLFFTGLIALPAVFLTPGEPIPALGGRATVQGARAAAMLLMRAEATATLAAALVFSTRWAHVLKALRVLGMPPALTVLLGMTHRYIYLLLQIAGDFFVARRSRQVGPLRAAQRRQIAAGAAGVLLGKSLQLSEEVYRAMQSRGFRGESHTLDEFRWRGRDTAAVAGFASAAGWALWWGGRWA